ncbi:MAG TPA: tetratricopeptide repeat protein [Blastocatellia bacterium]|nr:tetratricopeptide repeat protein [Blastocatellia bacterium]
MSKGVRTSFLLLALVVGSGGSPQKPSRPSSPPRPVAEADVRQQAVREFEEGQKVHAQGHLTEAIAHYSRALELIPDFPEALYQRALAELSLGQMEQAARDLARLIELEKDFLPDPAAADPSVRSFFARVHNLQAELFIRQNDPARAEEELTKALARDPGWPRVRLNLASLFLSRRALDRAITELQQVIAREAPPAEAFSLLGAAYEQAGRTDDAIEQYSRALALDPNDRLAREGRSRLLLQRKDYLRAVEDLEILQKVDPSPDRALQLADAYAHINKDDQAIALCQKLLLEDPKNRPARERLIAWLAKSGRIADALAEARRATELFPTDATAWGRLGELLLSTDAEEAVRAYGRAVALEPSNLVFRANYGSALLKSRRFTDALEQFRAVLARDPENAHAHAGLGTAFYELKDYAQASHHFGWIVERQPQQPVAYYFLAICNDRLGQYEPAMTLYEKFIALADPLKHKNEIENARLRIPALKRLIEEAKRRRKESKR